MKCIDFGANFIFRKCRVFCWFSRISRIVNSFLLNIVLILLQRSRPCILKFPFPPFWLSITALMKNWTFSLVIDVNFIKENTWRIRSLSLFTTSFHVLDKSGVAHFSPICKNLSYSLDFDHDILICNLNAWENISKTSRKTFANSLRNNHPPLPV